MTDLIEKLKTPEECETFAKNVTERGRPDLALAARKRAVALRAAEYGAQSDIERECIEAVYAYEEILSQKNGKKTKASRTWPMIKKHGIIVAVERAVNREAESQGYTALVEMGLEDYAFEAVILRHPEAFSTEVVERSRLRVAAHQSQNS
ncbi:hypothetical protein [Methylobacillus sp.]|uniref:hypothetical protein n=1 Tax=Methylobacillus sp. TaxID=56818 RepID=UPI0012CD9B26|nr:hypothetical protein [Methylobacillus sp.]MPS48760.1 hypothetical protein [Methylobacillus sp.]